MNGTTRHFYSSIARAFAPYNTVQDICKRQKTVGVALLFVAAILPTLLVDIPAIEDYPNHLARMYILTTTGTQQANPYYQITWALYADIAMDLVVPQLARFVDVETAARLFFLIGQLLIVSGAIAIEFVVKRRHEIAGIMALMALHSLPFSLGLVNFEFGTGVALWGIACWIALARGHKWWLRFAVHSAFVCILFVAHFFALGIYGLTIGLCELERLFQLRFNLRHATRAAATLASPAIILLLLMRFSGANVGGRETEWLFAWKPMWIALFLNGYSPLLAAGSAAVLIIVIGYLAFKGTLSLSGTGKWIGLGFLLVFIAMPFKIFDSRMADIRMIAAAFLVLPAFVTFSPVSKSLAYIAATAAAMIVLINAGYVAFVWLDYRSDYAAIKASFPLIPRGSFVLVGQSVQAPPTLLTDLPMSRAPTLAVYYAGAFVSSLYTLPGQHAVHVRSDLKRLEVDTKTETYEPPSLAMLRALTGGEDVANAPGYARNWPRDFDYVYLVGARAEATLPDLLEEVTTGRRFTLYRVRK
jgi:hypothetical protein